ncbi:MAG: GNAT family N-acetyltransferase [candidate division Zixibacteria bacterium]|nr:GNAT family N-acetyltransferase [candidate division Zixibacteria bacterium]
MLIFTTDKKHLLRHFRKDPVLFAYHIGDLDDFFFSNCLWPAVFDARGDIDDVLLTYTGGDTPVLLAFGLSERFGDLLREYLPIAPRKFFCHFQEQHRAILREFARETPLGTHLKMKLDDARFTKLHGNVGQNPLVVLPFKHHDHNSCSILRFDPSHESQLRALYAAAYPDSYFTPRMLQTGRFFGCLDHGAIVAVAGVHVVSDEHHIAALGNITTHPDYRGRGLAALVTHRLTSEFVSEGKMVCLNVKADNAPAIACYKKLGFVPIHEYEEALYELKAP